MSLFTSCPYCGINLIAGQACTCEEWQERERECKEKRSGFRSTEKSINSRVYKAPNYLKSLDSKEVVDYFKTQDYISQLICDRCGNPNARTMTIGVSGGKFKCQGFVCENCETEFFAKIWPEFIDNGRHPK